jgi:hypothetical protein
MADWPKGYTTPVFAFIQDRDDTGLHWDRCEIGTANYKVGKVTRSKPERGNATPNVKGSARRVMTKKEY